MTTDAQRAAAARIRDERRRWRDLVDAVGPARLDEGGAMGEWTFGDLAGHLAGWREHRLRELEAAARGEPAPAPPWPAGLVENDEINDWIHEHQSGTVQDRIDAYDATFERLASAIEALPETMADRPGRLRVDGWHGPGRRRLGNPPARRARAARPGMARGRRPLSVSARAAS